MKHYFAKTEEERQAFLDGARTILNIIQHTAPNDIPAIVANQDDDWILHLCANEQRYQRAVRAEVDKTICENFVVNFNRLRGMLLGLANVDKNGISINPITFNPCKDQPYGYHWRNYYDGQTITTEEFNALTPEQQDDYYAEAEIILFSTVGSIMRTMTSSTHLCQLYVAILLQNESQKMLERYRQVLEAGDYPIILDFEDIILEEIERRHITFRDPTEDTADATEDGAPSNDEADPETNPEANIEANAATDGVENENP